MSMLEKDVKIQNNIELVSLHIPKTAGTSFRNILREVYGKSHVVRLDIRRDIELNGKVFSGSRLKTGIKVIHGHFSYQELIDHFNINKDIPVVTWIREPAERVISNYFYLDHILKTKLHKEKKSMNILSRMQKSILEYAAVEANRNRMSKFLDGIEVKELSFIGFTEHYEEDLQYLGNLLNWDNYSVLKQNITEKKPDVDPETLARIKELNASDYEIFNEAMKIRDKRIKAQS